jgi:hypothetical protein
VTVSVVLRLVDAALHAGRLAGEAEIVATGERATVRDADELIRFVTRSRDALLQRGVEAIGMEPDGRSG